VETWEVHAREAIRDLVARYNACGDAADIDAVVELFGPEAVLEVGPRDGATVYRGRDEIRSLFAANQRRWSAHAASSGRPHYVRHFVSTHEISFDGPEQARGRSYFLVLMAHGLDHWGRYFDDYAVLDGRWSFARRRVRLDRTPTEISPPAEA
jgi:hypothetical protein